MRPEDIQYTHSEIVERGDEKHLIDLEVLTENASSELLAAVKQDPLSASELEDVAAVIHADVPQQAEEEFRLRDTLSQIHPLIQKWGLRALALLVLAGGFSVYEDTAKKHAEQVQYARTMTSGKVTTELTTALTDNQEIVIAHWLERHPEVQGIDLKDTLGVGSDVLLNGSITYPFTTQHDSYPRKPNTAEALGMSDTMATTVVGKFIEKNLDIHPSYTQRFDGALNNFLHNADTTIENDKQAFALEYVRYVSDPDAYEKEYLTDKEKMDERFKEGPISVADSDAMKLMHSAEFKQKMLPYLRKKYADDRSRLDLVR